VSKELKEQALARIEAAHDRLVSLSRRIHSHPELAFEEYQASRWVASELERAGMSVELGVADLPTAFLAEAGPGPLTLGVCAEYDALPGIGHACGHNVIAAAAVGVAVGLIGLVEDLGIRLRVFGTPAEERGGGKILMLERGVFQGTNAAMMIHPSYYEGVEARCLAVAHHVITYSGKEAHASMQPEAGINAADAMVIAQVAIGLLRQQLRMGDQVHGVVLEAGEAPNVIPARARASYYIRSVNLHSLEELWPRVRACFEAGAHATGAELQIEQASPPYSEFRSDPGLACAFEANLRALGRIPLPRGSEPLGGSTDMANVSLVMPAIHPWLDIGSAPAVNHQPAFARAAISPAADRAIRDGAAAMAWTMIDLATEASQRARLLGAEGP
jgi:amidohydrolase